MKNLLNLTILFLFISPILLKSQSTDSLIYELDTAIAQSKEFQKNRKERILGIKALLNDAAEKGNQLYFIYSKLYEEYRTFQFDSALHYLSLEAKTANKLDQNDLYYEALIHKVRLFSSTGMYQEAFDALRKINRSDLKKKYLKEYYPTLAKFYNELGYYSRIPGMVPVYDSLKQCYRDSALNLLQKGSLEYKREKELYYHENHQIKKSLNLALNLLSQTDVNDSDHALFAYRAACNYRDLNKPLKEKEYLIRSAISDIRNGIKDNASLAMLAKILYRENKIAKAYSYIQFSLDDARFYNAPLRFIELSNILPVINDAYNLKLEKQKTTLQRYFMLISILILFLIISLIFTFRQYKRLATVRIELLKANKRLNSLNDELSGANGQLIESNHIKEQYIGHFLDRCSNYIEKIEDYQAFVKKQIISHNIDGLLGSIRSRKLIDAEIKEFYETFDQTFLILFPNFVDQINMLFKENEHIDLREGELLNTELRIFALIRLGITDSSRIAGLLRYSVNTIYNYRVKVRNKSKVPRDYFEEMVKKIGSFENKAFKSVSKNQGRE